VAAPTPTRAEASDVATAIYDGAGAGADAVMLSAESATGRYPREAVEMMDRIIRSTEQHKLYRSIIEASQPNEEQTPPHAVAAAAADLAKAIHAPAIVAFTSSGTTASFRRRSHVRGNGRHRFYGGTFGRVCAPRGLDCRRRRHSLCADRDDQQSAYSPGWQNLNRQCPVCVVLR
jgi:hypothetical protein